LKIIMKKALSYILIIFVISANLFAPISVGWRTKSNSLIQENKAEAATSGIKLNSSLYASDNTVKDTLTIFWDGYGSDIGDKSYATITLYGINGVKVITKEIKLTSNMDNLTTKRLLAVGLKWVKISSGYSMTKFLLKEIGVIDPTNDNPLVFIQSAHF